MKCIISGKQRPVGSSGRGEEEMFRVAWMLERSGVGEAWLERSCLLHQGRMFWLACSGRPLG